MPDFEKETNFVPWLEDLAQSKKDISAEDFSHIVRSAVTKFDVKVKTLCDELGVRRCRQKVIERWSAGFGLPVFSLRKRAAIFLSNTINKKVCSSK